MKNQFRVAAALVGVMVSGAAFSNTMTVNPGTGAGTQGTGGVVEFSGEIVDTSCNITPTSKDVKVDLGKWAKSYFSAIGDETTKTPFTISVDNCPTSVKTVAVLFDGKKDATDSTLLAVAGGATGVGIKLYNGGASAAPVALGTVTEKVPVTSGKADLPFFADYASTVNTVTTGAANGVANFLMVYN